MNTTTIRPHRSVLQRLLETPHRFGFFQAVRLLERWSRHAGDSHGCTGLQPRVVFRNSLSLAFPASEIEDLRVVFHREERERALGADSVHEPIPRDSAAPASPSLPSSYHARAAAVRPLPADGIDPARIERLELTPAFFSLLGAGGALPSFYTELLAEHEHLRRAPDPAAPRAFYDIFLHRATTLFYRAWCKHRVAVQLEADRRKLHRPLVLCLAGLGPNGMQDRLHAREGGVADDALAYYAAALQRRPVSCATLQRLLQDYFDAPVRIQGFVGRWFTLSTSNRTQLGSGPARLGQGAVVGERVWQRDLRVRLEIGPLGLERFRRFLPGGTAALALKELLSLLTGPTLEYEVRLGLRAQEVKGCRLAMSGPRLGHDSFLITRASTVDRHDAGYDLLATA